MVLSRRRLCRNQKNAAYVILNKVKNLDRSIGYKRRDPSAWPQDDIATQSLEGEENELGRTLKSKLPKSPKKLSYPTLWHDTLRHFEQQCLCPPFSKEEFSRNGFNPSFDELRAGFEKERKGRFFERNEPAIMTPRILGSKSGLRSNLSGQGNSRE
jgi:hypothetical protein